VSAEDPQPCEIEADICPGRTPIGGRRYCYEGCPDWPRVQDRLDCPAHLQMCGICEQKIVCPCHVLEARSPDWHARRLAWIEQTRSLPVLRPTVLRPLR